MINIITDQNIEIRDKILKVVKLVFNNYKKTCKNLNINLIDDKSLLKINNDFLNKDYLTDIITFNYSENKRIIDGDVYISYERIKDNATNRGLSEQEELERIIVHGALHLCGEEDYTKEQRESMTKLENKYLAKLVPRGT